MSLLNGRCTCVVTTFCTHEIYIRVYKTFVGEYLLILNCRNKKGEFFSTCIRVASFQRIK